MQFAKTFLIVVSLWGIAFFAQTKASRADTWTRAQTSGNLLQTQIPESCNVERNVRWFNHPAPRGYTKLASPGACCEFCQGTSGCKAWVWRHAGRICYLLDTIGEKRYCYDCIGGIPDELEPTDDEEEPIDDEDIDAILKKCEEDGRIAARAAATVACITLTNTCLTAASEERTDAAKKTTPAGSTPLHDVVERSCNTVFTQTCRSASFNRTSEVNAPCAAILDRGPGNSTRGCEGINEARRIFNHRITKLCASLN